MDRVSNRSNSFSPQKNSDGGNENTHQTDGNQRDAIFTDDLADNSAVEPEQSGNCKRVRETNQSSGEGEHKRPKIDSEDTHSSLVREHTGDIIALHSYRDEERSALTGADFQQGVVSNKKRSADGKTAASSLFPTEGAHDFYFRNFLSSLPTVQSKKIVDLSGKPTEKRALEWAKELQENKTLKILKVKRFYPPDDTIKTLIKALEKNSNLKVLELDLSFHPFLDDPDDFSLPFLAEILKSELIALEKLVLHFHDFPDDRIGALAEALNDNSTLKVIEISLDLGTSDSALKVLIDAVGTIKTLEALKFKDMSWSASRAEMVADGIANNKTLMLLEMGYPFAALSDERAEIFTNTLASIPNLEILTLHCTHGVSNFSTRMHEGEDCKISILAKAFEGNQKLSVLRLEAENIDLMRHGVLALFKNKNIAKLTLTFFPKKEYESELLNALKDNLTLISFKLISESSIDSFANKGIEDKCTKYIKRNKDKFYDFYSAIRRFESATTEVIPNDVAKLIFGKTFPYFNQYIEPSW